MEKKEKKERKVEIDRWERVVKSDLSRYSGCQHFIFLQLCPSTLFFYNFAIELNFQSFENISNVFSVFIKVFRPEPFIEL